MLNRLHRVYELLEQDSATDLTVLHQRDREIGVALSSLARSPHRQILGWAARRDPQWERIAPAASAGAGVILVVLGLLLGLAACAGALYFEGGGRVNVVSLLGLLVGLQLLSLVLTGLGMLPQVLRRVRGIGAVTAAIELLSPAGAVVAVLRRWFPGAGDALSRNNSAALRDLRLFARVRRWNLWWLSQTFAVAFNLGVVTCFVAMVVFTDLAFGWSTTLTVPETTAFTITSAIAMPWEAVWPAAVPSLELVESSRYFRAQTRSPVDAELLGQWWPFVLASLVCYGLLPRLALWLLACWQRARAQRWTLLHLPGAGELIHRLNQALVTTHEAQSPDEATQAAPPSRRVSVAPAPGSCSLILWGEFQQPPAALEEEVRAATALDPVETHQAGGLCTPEQDNQVINALDGSARPIALAVKSWEPPLSELTDFLAELRRRSGGARALVVVPVPEPARAAPAQEDVDIWRDRLSLLGDPWLSVRATTLEDAP